MNNRFDTVRELVKDPSLRVTDIARQTGYNKGHVSRLRKESKGKEHMKPKFLRLLEKCVLDGVVLGHGRAYKHNPEPQRHDINEAIVNEVMNELHEWFNFGDGAYADDTSQERVDGTSKQEHDLAKVGEVGVWGQCEPQPALEDGWSNWICPKPTGYLMQCCDCELIHEVDFRVVRYKSKSSEVYEVIDDRNLQAQMRMKRRDDLSPKGNT